MKINNLRWIVVGLVALAAVINYIDRNALGVLWPFMGNDIYPEKNADELKACLLYTSPSPRDLSTSRMPSSA